MVFHVEIEGTASESDAELVREIFQNEGLGPSVSTSYGIGGDALETALWIAVIHPATRFFGEVTASVARNLVDDIWKKRSEATKGASGIVVLNEYRRETSPAFSVALEPGLPIAAYEDLSQLTKSLKRGKVMYEKDLEGWVIDDRELRSEIQYLYDQFVFTPKRPWWQFWA